MYVTLKKRRKIIKKKRIIYTIDAACFTLPHSLIYIVYMRRSLRLQNKKFLFIFLCFYNA